MKNKKYIFCFFFVLIFLIFGFLVGQVLCLEDYNQGMVIGGTREAAMSLDYSPDGTKIVTSYVDGSIIFWDVIRGVMLRQYKPEIVAINSVRYSPDGNLVAWGTEDGMVKIWNTFAGRCKYALRGHSKVVRMIAFSPDGNQIVSAGTIATALKEGRKKITLSSDPLRIWRVFTGVPLGILQGHNYGAMAVTFSKDGKILASGGAVDGEIILWDPVERVELLKFTAHGSHVLDLKFSKDGKYFATCSADYNVQLYEIKRRKMRHKKTLCHPFIVSSIDFSPDGELLAAGCYDQKIHIWRTDRGREVAKFSGHTGNIEGVCFSPDGRFLASCGYDKTVKIWDIKREKCIMTLIKPRNKVSF